MKKEEDKNNNIFWIIGGVCLLVIGLWIGTYFFTTSNYCPDEWGVIGDMFGSINALFSGLAFVGLIFTIILQSTELKETREVLKDQKEELNLTRGIFETQTKLMRVQQFESTFFKLLPDKSEESLGIITSNLQSVGLSLFYDSEINTEHNILFEERIKLILTKTINYYKLPSLLTLLKNSKKNGVIQDVSFYKEVMKNEMSQNHFNGILYMSLRMEMHFPKNFAKQFTAIFNENDYYTSSMEATD